MKSKSSKDFFVYDSDIEVSPEIHDEYINYHCRVNIDDYKYQNVITQSKVLLFEVPTSSENQKKLLFLLGHFATSESYCILKQYLADPKTSLKPWATLAMQDIYALAGSQMSKKDRAVISSSVGGDNNRLRFYVCLTTIKNKRLTEIHKRILSRELDQVARKSDSKVEEIEFGKSHMLVKILISVDVAPQKPIDKFLDICSTKYKILRYHFMMVNTHKITNKEIHEYIKEVEPLDKSK